VRYGRGSRRAARFSAWAPTVNPICASSPAAFTAVVASSAPVGGPFLRPSGSGAGAAVLGSVGVAFGGFLAVAFDAPAADGLFAALAVFVAPARDGAPAVLVAPARGLVAARRRLPSAARFRPIGVGRVEGRLARTLGCAAARVDFLLFFFPDLSDMTLLWGAIPALLRAPTGYIQRPKWPPPAR
jgi:hypothetical protein